jgi:hypothetical protein
MKLNSTNYFNPGPVIDDLLISRAWNIVNTYEQSLKNQEYFPSVEIDPVRKNTCCGLCPFLVLALLQVNHNSIKMYRLIKDYFFNYDSKAEQKFSFFHESQPDRQTSRSTKIQIPVAGKHAFLFSLAAKTIIGVDVESKESPFWEIFTSTPIVPDHFFIVFQDKDTFRIVQGFYGHYTFQQFAAETEDLESFIPMCPRPTLKNWHGEVKLRPKYRGNFGKPKMVELLRDLELLNNRHKKGSAKHQEIYAGITCVKFKKEIMPKQFAIKVLHVTLP